MLKLLTTLAMLLSTTSALADKYGVDESMAETDGSWGGVALVILLLVYLHFKGK